MRQLLSFPSSIKNELYRLKPQKDGYFHTSYDLAYKIAAWKLDSIKQRYGAFAIASIGGARSSCESAYVFQKFTRRVLNSPHVDNCARVCHAPSLKGMRAVVGEGAATNPFSDIYKSEFLIIIGSNTTEAHPIVANKISKARKNGLEFAVFDIRETSLFKSAKYTIIQPYESNLLILNALAYVIISEGLYNKEFIENRCEGFEEYKESILNDKYANPAFFRAL